MAATSRRFALPAVAELARQLAYAPAPTRAKQLERAAALAAELDPAQAYPLAFVVFRVSGYRPEVDGPLLAGDALRRDLARFVLAISEGLDLAATDRPGGALSIDEACAESKVGVRSIHRWRREGLLVRRLRFADGVRRLGIDRRDLARFVSARRRGAAGPAPTRIGGPEAARLVARFRALRDDAVPATRAAETIAAELGRSREAVRKHLIAAGCWRERRAAISTERFRSRLLAAFDRLVFPAEIASRSGRDAKAALAECRRLRVARLRSIELPKRRFPTFERPDAARVIPATPLAQRGFLEQWMPTDAMALLEECRGIRASRHADAEIEALLAVEAWLLGEAADRIEALEPREAALDQVEWRLRWALAIRRRLARRLQPLVVARIEQALGGPLASRTAGEIRTLLRIGFRTIAEALDRFEPATRSGPSRSLRGVLALAVDRAVARPIEAMPTRRAAARHEALPLDDPSATLAPWASPIAGPDRLRKRRSRLDPADRGLLERRHGWGDERPHSIAELAAADGVPFTRLAARLWQAHRMLWRPRRQRM